MKIFIYGTGNSAEDFYEKRMNESIEILGFLDSDENKWGDKVPFASEFTITGIEDIGEKEYDFIAIASTYSEIVDILLDAGISMKKIVCLYEAAYNDAQNNFNNTRFLTLNKIMKPEEKKSISRVINRYPQGHFYSTVNNLEYIKANEDKIFDSDLPEKAGIFMNWKEQIELYHLFCEQGCLLKFPNLQEPSFRYYERNDLFNLPAVHVLNHIICKFDTKRIIEAGSGFSSASMLDINEKMLNQTMELIFIEPFPKRLKGLLHPKDNIRLIEKNLQDINLAVFKELQYGDILFIDSSHVGKTGSDVNYILFEILPILQNGVIIHFHDIFYPFEYPQKWIYEGRGWNESYMLRCFLQYNSNFKILFWEGAIRHYLENVLKENIKNNEHFFGGGSIYIQKICE